MPHKYAVEVFVKDEFSISIGISIFVRFMMVVFSARRAYNSYVLARNKRGCVQNPYQYLFRIAMYVE